MQMCPDCDTRAENGVAECPECGKELPVTEPASPTDEDETD